MKRALVSGLIILFLLACSKPQVGRTGNEAPGIPWVDSSTRHPDHAARNALLLKYARQGLPGISLLINDKHGTWVGSTGKADMEHNVPFQPGTVSKVASVTKLFIGALTFKVMEDSVNTTLGYNALHQPISKWLPSRITGKLANGSVITLGQCMNHETGLPDLIEEDKFYLDVINHPNKKWEAEELLEFIYNKDALFKPSDTAIYSNTNTVLVALVLEYATRRKHSELLKQYVLTPLNLQNTFYQPHDVLPNTVAQGYLDLYNNNTIVNVSNWVPGSGNGFGGIFSNVFDLYKFGTSLMVEQTFLKPASLSRMMTFGKTDDINRYGYGIMKKFINLGVDAGYGHSGRDLGYTANLFYFPNKGVTHAFVINYGTDADTRLRKVFYAFQDELIALTLK